MEQTIKHERKWLSVENELNKICEARETVSDSLHQAIMALDELKLLAGKSVIAKDFEITAYVLRDALLKTNSHIDILKKAIENATFEVSCAICGTIAETAVLEKALNYQHEHERKNNNLHQCVVIEK